MHEEKTGIGAGASGGRPGSILAELWQFREMVRSLVSRDIKVKYQRSLFGLIWTLLNPLITVAVLITVFTYVIRIQLASYWAFLISGFFAWNFVQQCLFRATTILRDHASLSRSVYFPTEALIISASLARLFEFILEVTVVIAVVAVFHHHALPASLVLMPFLFLVQLLMTIGLMYPIAAAAVLFYDVQHALPIVITVLFYLSPVFYPVTMIPEAYQPLYHANPVVGILGLYHVVLYEGNWPSLKALGSVSVTAVIICLAGHALFRRYKGVCIEIA